MNQDLIKKVILAITLIIIFVVLNWILIAKNSYRKPDDGQYAPESNSVEELNYNETQ